MTDELDLAALRDSVRDFLKQECGTDVVLRHIDSGAAFHRGLWDQVAALGWLALSVPEEHGGLGLDANALAILYEEAGRTTAPLPLLGTLLVADALARAGSETQQQHWLPIIAAGVARGAISSPEQAPSVSARIDGDEIVLDGEERHLLDGAEADIALIQTDAGLVIVEPSADGVALRRFQTADQTRTLASVTFVGTRIPTNRLLRTSNDASFKEALAAHALIGIAADSRGGANAIFEHTLEYLKTREQFGRAIGSFQALKHRCADHKTALTAVDELVQNASFGRSADEGFDPIAVRSAKLRASKTYAEVADDAVQLHGGIGFTWEQQCHLFLKRAKLNEMLFGSESVLADRIAELLAAQPLELFAGTTRTSGFDPLGKREDVAEFRAELRDWLAAKTPEKWQDRMAGATEDEYRDLQNEWLNEMRAVGLATPHWPREWGGEDLTLAQKIVIYEELARSGAPDVGMFTISLYHLPATLFARGTERQRERYLRGVIEDREVWVQGFSEPGAGSDLAALRTRADRTVKPDGSVVYVVNGQKIWSSYGQFAHRMLLLARTDFAAKPKQAGISYFICDMDTPGIIVRPIRQITGDAEFNEVFFDNVEIPAENLIGAENEGWMIAQSTLSAERGLIVFGLAERSARAVMRDFANGKDSWLHDDQLRREWILLWLDVQAVRLLIRRMLAEIEANPHMSGGTSNYIKLLWATTLHSYTALMLKATGIEGLAWQSSIAGGGHMTGLRVNDYLRSFAWTISGGTNEVMRNVIAERFLGLPKDPRPQYASRSKGG